MTEPCQNCLTWGRTCDPAESPGGLLVACPKCHRLTWPNLGVNLPAGASVAVSHAAAMAHAQSTILPAAEPNVGSYPALHTGHFPDATKDTPGADFDPVPRNRYHTRPHGRAYTKQDARAAQKRVEKRRAKKKAK